MRLRSIYPNEGGWLRIHVEDADQYELTNDNGVDVDLTPEQVTRIVWWALKNVPGLAEKALRKLYRGVPP